MNKEGKKVSVEIVQALLLILKLCLSIQDCTKCKLKDFCGKLPTEW